jgi:hypothetical protein
MTEEHPDQSAPKRLGVPLLELKPGQCRFIVGERVSPARFCGEVAVHGGSWCEKHHRLDSISSSSWSRTAGRG